MDTSINVNLMDVDSDNLQEGVGHRAAPAVGGEGEGGKRDPTVRNEIHTGRRGEGVAGNGGEGGVEGSGSAAAAAPNLRSELRQLTAEGGLGAAMEAYDAALLAELQKKAEEVFPGAPITVTWFLEQCDSSMEERRIFQSKERPILVPE